LELDRRQQRAKRGTETIPLTSKEVALLELFLLHAGDWITRSEILEQVWEHHSDTGSNLVDVYINRVRNKIDQNGFTKLIHTVRGVGYRLGLPEKKKQEVKDGPVLLTSRSLPQCPANHHSAPGANPHHDHESEPNRPQRQPESQLKSKMPADS
jgi:DNA-binding winged helix-turn-helix (wHTH) protein